MLRLFTAIAIPDDIRERLQSMAGGVKGARWHPPGNYHMTLRFIGTVDEGVAEDIDAALAEYVDIPAFMLALDGMGLFESKGKPRILWAGVRPSETLDRLKKRADRALDEAGLLAPDTRKYHPHVTLARLKDTKLQKAAEFVEANGMFLSREFDVTDFGLYISHSTHDGPVYERISSYPLRRSGE